MSDYTPSPELVEALGWLETMAHGRLGDIAVEVVLEAAVAYRSPGGHPELVPWVEVAALVDAARYVADFNNPLLARLDACAALRAALAPFTQDPTGE